MKRIIRPIAYILGFSVFCACTTTKTIPVGSLSNEPQNLVVLLQDGSELSVRTATLSPDSIRGEITAKDSKRLSQHFEDWQSQPTGLPVSDGIELRWVAYAVVIPVADVREITGRSDGKTVAAVLLLALLAGGILAAAAWEGPFGDLGK